VKEPGTAFVKVANLVKRFGLHAAVDGVSLEVAEGHTLALLGPSGCGKTTILRCLAGLETPEQGFLEIAGKVVFDSTAGVNVMPEARALGIVFQSYAVWPHMSVAENVGFPLKGRGVARAEQRDRVTRILDIVGLSAWVDRPATQLSGGQQQRVALARALVHEPRLVLFDEPMSNLDAQLREQVRMELKLLQERLRFTAIYVTHDQAEAFALAERIVVMNRGRVDTFGAPKDVFHRPSTPFVARFLGLNVLEGTIVQTNEVLPFANGASGQPPGVGYAQVMLRGGLQLWGRAERGARLNQGTRVLFCIRKEHVGLRPADGLLDGAAQAIPATVRAASFLGLAEEYMVDLGGLELRAIRPYAGMQAGDAVAVHIEPEDCIVLPEEPAERA
jgi:iron(III) transport system ATP-binding protein